MPSPLVQAALDGSCCILDGVDRLPGETLASLSRLLQDRFERMRGVVSPAGRVVVGDVFLGF
jgi:hypothetical protein